MDDLTPQEQEFLDLLIEDVKLSDIEWESKFGNDLPELRRNLSLRRIAADAKIQRQKLKNIANYLKVEKLLRLIPKSIDKLEQFIDSDDETVSFKAVQQVLKGSLGYLEKAGQSVAQTDHLDGAKIKTDGEKLIIDFGGE